MSCRGTTSERGGARRSSAGEVPRRCARTGAATADCATSSCTATCWPTRHRPWLRCGTRRAPRCGGATPSSACTATGTTTPRGGASCTRGGSGAWPSARLLSGCTARARTTPASTACRRPSTRAGSRSTAATSSIRAGSAGSTCGTEPVDALATSAQQVAQLAPLGVEVGAVLGRRRDEQGHALDDAHTAGLERVHLTWVVGEQPQLLHTRGREHLRRHAVLARVGRVAQPLVGLDRVEPLVLQRVGARLVVQADAAALLPQVEQHAAPLAGDEAQREIEIGSASCRERVTCSGVVVESEET